MLYKEFPESSNVVSAEHNGNDLLVTFRDGRRYTYSDVPVDVAQQLFNAPSPGGFLAANIKGFYLFTELVADQPVPAGKDVTNNTQALLEAALKASSSLPECRARAIVATKIDEALLWLTRVPKK
jgi:hypothetical protein